MKHHLYFHLILLLLMAANYASAQNTDNPGDYMTSISKARGDMDSKYMQYISAAAHGRRARKVEKLRQQVLEVIAQSRDNTAGLPRYKGDNSLRQGSMDYIQLCYHVFNEDYKKVVDLEEVAEQSVDEMQAYILLQKKIGEKLHDANESFKKVEEDFAARNNVRLVHETSPLAEKLNTSAKLDDYVNRVYILFFKCSWEDGQITKALNNKKVNDIEQARNALDRYAMEGLQTLDTMKAFENDPTLANSCKRALEFFKMEAEKDIPLQTDYYLKQEEFEKAKKSFESSSGDRSKADVDAFNKKVKDINNAVNMFNQNINNVNRTRTDVINDWNSSEKSYVDEHTPRYKKSDS